MDEERAGPAGSQGSGSVAPVGLPVGLPVELTAPFDAITDVIVVMAADGTIVHANPFAGRLLGIEPATAAGRSIADFLHPDDMLRALEVIELMRSGSLEVPITPADYRLHHADGGWVPVEINAGSWRPVPDGDELTLLVGRYSGDHDVQDRVLELLTSGAPIDEVVDLVPQFGSWRHPTEHYAVLVLDGAGGFARVAGSPLAADLVAVARAEGAGAPWDLAVARAEDVLAWSVDLPPGLAAAASRHGLVGCWAVPVEDRSGSPAAVLVAWARQHGPAPSVHRYSLEVMARALGLILQWSEQLAELERAAREDPLTGATNRSRFFELLDASPPSDPVGVLYADLDGFKAVNDLYGHTLGDAVLCEVADRIRAAVRPGDVAGRIGGDEFAVLCPAVSGVDEAAAVADRMIQAVQRPIAIGGLTLSVGLSVGVAVAEAGDPGVDRLVEQADRALYRAKRAGRGRWSLDDDAR